MPAPPSRFAARVRTAIPATLITSALSGAIAAMTFTILMHHVIDGWWTRCLAEPTLGPAALIRVSSPARPAVR